MAKYLYVYTSLSVDTKAKPQEMHMLNSLLTSSYICEQKFNFMEFTRNSELI